jgi:NAD(P)-dependent dehydrogenase (short-subunit alcohol dehydrogenase family)
MRQSGSQMETNNRRYQTKVRLTPQQGLMREFAGKTAFVTGGASGIGLALGRAFANAGMKVMLADIEANTLSAAVEDLRGICPAVEGVVCDLADPDSVEQTAQATYSVLGNVHILCNNSGVAAEIIGG